MNLAELQVEIRSRSVGQTVAMATRMLQERTGRLLFAWALYSLPLLALAFGLLVGSGLSPWWIWVIVVTLAPAFSLPMVTTVGHLVFSPTIDVKTVLGVSLRRFFPHLILLLVNRVATAAGLVAVVVPGLYLWRAGWFLGPIVVLEGAGIGASLRRGRHFASGFFGLASVHAINAAALLAYWSVALAAVGHFLIKRVVGLNIAIVGDLARMDDYYHALGLAAFCLAVPFVTMVWFFVYLEVRTRKEGWDLEIAFRAKRLQLERSSAR